MRYRHLFSKIAPAGLLGFSFIAGQNVWAADHDKNAFGGLAWGPAISLTWDTGSNDRIKSASLVDGIIRIDDQENATARLMLEAHYFFTPGRSKRKKEGGTYKRGADGNFVMETGYSSFLGLAENSGDNIEWGWGPFVAIQPGENDIVASVAAGIMVGFKRKKEKSDSSSFNFGVGIVVDPNAQILGDGLMANMPLPPGETQVRFKQKEQVGILFLFSAAF